MWGHSFLPKQRPRGAPSRVLTPPPCFAGRIRSGGTEIPFPTFAMRKKSKTRETAEKLRAMGARRAAALRCEGLQLYGNSAKRKKNKRGFGGKKKGISGLSSPLLFPHCVGRNSIRKRVPLLAHPKRTMGDDSIAAMQASGKAHFRLFSAQSESALEKNCAPMQCHCPAQPQTPLAPLRSLWGSATCCFPAQLSAHPHLVLPHMTAITWKCWGKWEKVLLNLRNEAKLRFSPPFAHCAAAQSCHGTQWGRSRRSPSSGPLFLLCPKHSALC